MTTTSQVGSAALEGLALWCGLALFVVLLWIAFVTSVKRIGARQPEEEKTLVQFSKGEDGRIFGDTAFLSALLGRSPAAVRTHCERGPDGYDVEAAKTVLATVDEPVLLTAPEAERHLSIPVGTIYSWVSRGRLKPVDRRERRPVYRASDLVALADREDTPTQS